MQRKSSKPTKRRSVKRSVVQSTPYSEIDPGQFLKGFFEAEEEHARRCRSMKRKETN